MDLAADVARAAAAGRRAEPGVLPARSPRAMRERKLTFGDRVHCPFLRPFFLTARGRGADPHRGRDDRRGSASASREAALASPALLDQLGHDRGRRSRLAAIDPGYATREHRLAARRVPAAGLAALRRIQRRVAGRARLHAAALRAVRRAAGDGALPRRTHDVRFHRTIDAMLDALLASYREWGGRAQPPTIAIVDWREVPTWTEFEILRDAFVARRRADDRLRSARSRRSTAGTLTVAGADGSTSSTAAC